MRWGRCSVQTELSVFTRGKAAAELNINGHEMSAIAGRRANEEQLLAIPAPARHETAM